MLVGNASYEAFIDNYLPDETYFPYLIGSYYTGKVALVRRYPTMLTFRIDIYDTNWCGASCSGAAKRRYININPDGKLLSLSDVIMDTSAFFEITKNHVESSHLSLLVFPGSVFLPPDWYITQHEDAFSISLQFQPYEITPGVVGLFALTIPGDEFGDLRVPQYWTKSYSGEEIDF